VNYIWCYVSRDTVNSRLSIHAIFRDIQQNNSEAEEHDKKNCFPATKHMHFLFSLVFAPIYFVMCICIVKMRNKYLILKAKLPALSTCNAEEVTNMATLIFNYEPSVHLVVWFDSPHLLNLVAL
jgi:hypothetical protein